MTKILAKAGRRVQQDGPDTEWFKARLADKQMSMRKLATLMNLDVSAVSLMLNGKRGMSALEAAEAARLLGVPVDEVMRHAGIDMRGAIKDVVPVVGWVDAKGEIHRGRVIGPKTVAGPPEEGLEAIRAQGGAFDGWLFFYRPIDRVSLEVVSRLCVVTIAGQDDERLAWVHRGYEPGGWNLASFDGSGGMVPARLASASPVVWTRQ